MIQDLQHFQELYNSKKIQIFNNPLNKIIQKFQFFVHQQNKLLDSEIEKEIIKEIQYIKERKNESKIIVIDQLEKPYDEYLIIIFDETIIIVSQNDQEFIISLLNQQEESTIFTVSDKDISSIPIEIQSKVYKYEEPFKKEYLTTVNQLSANLILKSPNEQKIKNLWKTIQTVLSSYFINKSYSILHEKRQSIYDNEKQEIKLKEDNYLALQYLGQSNTSNVQLIFHYETEQLFALKRFIDSTEEKIFPRELKNFQKNIRHPNIPIFYGEAKIEGVDCLIIEYIRGQTLDKLKNIGLTENDKINIIIQLMLTIEFLQSKKLIYRDLKPNNLIFDDKRNIILIDFDRMIGIDEQKNPENRTTDFIHDYMAPELLNKNMTKYSYEEDVYSIGHLIYYIITQKRPTKGSDDNFIFDDFTSSYEVLKPLCEECCESETKRRPKITKLIDYFFNNFVFKNIKQIKCDIASNINETKFYPYWKCSEYRFLEQFLNGYSQKTKEIYSQEANNIHLFYQIELRLIYMYYPEEYFHVNISIFISCLSAISDENQSQSQFYLGVIYHKGEYISRDINKSIHYLTLSSNQNHSSAQYYLGNIYYNADLVKIDVIKGIDYLMQSSKNNYKYAHFRVGYVYHEGKHIEQDISKAIKYYKDGSNVNDAYAKNNLGIIYKNGFSDKITPIIQYSIEYFQESVRLDKTSISSYNLSHTYIYHFENNLEFLDKAIELLIS